MNSTMYRNAPSFSLVLLMVSQLCKGSIVLIGAITLQCTGCYHSALDCSLMTVQQFLESYNEIKNFSHIHDSRSLVIKGCSSQSCDPYVLFSELYFTKMWLLLILGWYLSCLQKSDNLCSLS